MRRYTLLICCLCLWIGGASQSQWEIGVHLGGTTYQGDLNPNDYPSTQSIGWATGLFVRNNLSPTWALRGNLLYGNWEGSDADATNDPFKLARDFSFQNRVTETSLLLEWDPFGNSRYRKGQYNFNTKITPYAFLGIGAAFYQLDNQYPVIDRAAILEDIRLDNTDSDGKVSLAIPAGLGLKIDLSKRTTLAFEGGVHYGFNDLIDGVSASGNPATNDWYWNAGTNLSIRFGKKDSDGDGIPDKLDACKLVPGSKSARGCPDRDLDGVEDAEDVCPDLAGLMEFSGCPDTDKDGIMDPMDGCPLLFGYEDTNGCPDRDNDCVIDSLDTCPDVEGLALLAGCPDTDLDGVADPDDGCPTERGLPEYGGCPRLDTDCDGIIDDLDLCPTIPDTLGFTGCPDLDGDGIIDSLDLCPDLPGVDSTQGCPVIGEVEEELLSEAQREVRFKTGSAELLNSSKSILDKIVELMQAYPNYQLNLVGYTDDVGRASTNQSLSKRRAKACYDYIVEKTIDADRLSYEGLGESNPIGDNKTKAGREMNRRVEFNLVAGQ